MEADRQRAIELIEEAVTAGARRFRACQILQIDVRTLQRWKQGKRSFQAVIDPRDRDPSATGPVQTFLSSVGV